jgi:hypothetical protein
LTDDLGIFVTPTTEVIDGKGDVVEIITGFNKQKFEGHMKSE